MVLVAFWAEVNYATSVRKGDYIEGRDTQYCGLFLFGTKASLDYFES